MTACVDVFVHLCFFDGGIIGDMKYFAVLPIENQYYTVIEIYE